MTFANFIFVIFLIVSLIIFAVLILLMRQIKKDGRLPAEKMTTLAAVLFIPAIVIFALVFKSISAWRSEIVFEQNRIEVERFVSSAYQPLAGSQQSLLVTLADMQTLLKDIQVLEMSFPSHADLIQKVKQQWQVAHNGLYKVYEDSDREIRHAWIAHKTMDSQDVLAKFSKQAVQIDAGIEASMKKYRAQLHSVSDDLIKNLDDARRLLDANRKPPKSKKQRLKNQNTQERIRHFSDRTKSLLMGLLGRINPQLREEVEMLQELIRVSGQQRVKVRTYLMNNQDLEKPLAKVIADWKQLEESSFARMNQILFAAEAEYIALKLGLAENNPAIKAMHKSLLVNLPAIVGKAMKERTSINQSYNFKN